MEFSGEVKAPGGDPIRPGKEPIVREIEGLASAIVRQGRKSGNRPRFNEIISRQAQKDRSRISERCCWATTMTLGSSMPGAGRLGWLVEQMLRSVAAGAGKVYHLCLSS